jgi:sugar/nucleoside kinase (ribokinase family)
MRALVVGDVCLDRWCRYDPLLSEPSRETGIPRNAVIETEVTPGAAGTVAANLASLGAGRVSVLGAVGEDGFGWELERAASQPISSSGPPGSRPSPTPSSSTHPPASRISRVWILSTPIRSRPALNYNLLIRFEKTRAILM